MYVSVEWLKSITDIQATEEDLQREIPANGLEIESVTKTGRGIQNIVTCEIVEISKHPDADKLFITKVNAGSHGMKQIVTNLKTVTVGMKLLVALEGVVLAGDFTIKKSKLKGVDSEGMFVGFEELGFEFKSEDPVILDRDVPNGLPYYEAAPFIDTIIDIELTSNRGDCLGMKGIATDIKARFNASLKEFTYTYKTSSRKVSEDISISVETDNCLRYTGAVIRNVTIKESPLWMRLRLIKAGIRPINNVVDITNYVLYEMNQPLHAFDLTKIDGKKLIIRNAMPGEVLVTLDGISRQLEQQDIVIADQHRGHCLGGIMGGQISEVTDSTVDIFLEAAYFNPVNIRKCSRRLGLRSESSYRFERDIDRANVDRALKRALYYFDMLGAGEISEGIIDEYKVPYTPKVISVTAEWINNKLGTDLSLDSIALLLRKLDFTAECLDSICRITVPSSRNDVTIKEDIAEEVARIFGYNNIKPTIYPSVSPGVLTLSQKNTKKLHSLLIESGCSEMMNFSFVGKSLFDKMQLPEAHDMRNVVTLEVPLTEDWSSMRSSLIPGLIRTASFNHTRQNKSFALYEIGNISIPGKELLPEERKKIGIMLSGDRLEKNYLHETEAYTFFDIKGIVEHICASFGVVPVFSPSSEVYLQPYQQASVTINGTHAGYIGKLHPSIADAFDIDKALFIAELDAELFLKSEYLSPFNEVPRFPSSERDMSFVIRDDVTADMVIGVIKSAGSLYLRDVSIFDIYRGANIDEGSYSLSVKLVFNKMVTTLTDGEIEKDVSLILENLTTKISAKLR